MIHDISVYRSYTSFTQNLYKKYATNGRNETCSIRKSHINKFEKNNENDNKYANRCSYIAQTYLMKYTIHSTNCRTKMIPFMWR